MPRSNIKIVKSKKGGNHYGLNTTTYFYSINGKSIVEVINTVLEKELKNQHNYQNHKELDFIKIEGNS